MEISGPDKSVIQHILPMAPKPDFREAGVMTISECINNSFFFFHNKNIPKTQAAFQKSFACTHDQDAK
jgi:hypothetical protein